MWFPSATAHSKATIVFVMRWLKNVLPQLSATDISAQASMKNAAKCDNHCELQNSVNQWNVERILHFWVTPGSIPGSVLNFYATWWSLCVLHLIVVAQQSATMSDMSKLEVIMI